LGRRFVPADHPRLGRVLSANGPVRFVDAALPDPFDGFLQNGRELESVHACMGCALRVDGVTVGALTVDALDPRAFDAVPDADLAMFAALAAAAMRTAGLIEATERVAAQQGRVAAQLGREAQQREGAEFLGVSAIARRMRDEVALLAGSDLTVLLMGETGVGKEVVARAIHAQSARRNQPLIYVNCAALPESIAESELFGHVRGAFTGATDTRAGKFEVADGGTLLLDEVGELPLALQPKLLRALQFGEIQRIGSDRAIRVDVRVLGATNRDLVEEVREGRFRADLFHRLSVYPLRIPPLRDRTEDVEVLAGFFLDAARIRLGLGPIRLTPGARDSLRRYDWPGNVRELQHVLLRAALRSSGGRRHEPVTLESRALDLSPGSMSLVAAAAPSVVDPDRVIGGGTLSQATDDFQKRVLTQALETSDGNWSEAARRLGVDRGNLHRLGKRLGMIGRSGSTLALLTFTLLTGCFAYGGVGDPCRNRADCQGELVCQDLICSDPEGCRVTHDCVDQGLCTARGEACVAVTRRDCESSLVCGRDGRCTARHDQCIATAEDCVGAEVCARQGKCLAREQNCVFGGRSAARCGETCAVFGRCAIDDRGECVAGSDTDCKTSFMCGEQGLCAARKDPQTGVPTCMAVLPEHCRTAKACVEGKACELFAGGCVPPSDALCRSRVGCADQGHCTHVDGVCVATGSDCLTSRMCLALGRCSAVKGGCEAVTEGDCRKGKQCDALGACTPIGGACLAMRDQDCEAAPGCLTAGACSAMGGKCGIHRDEDCRQAPFCRQEARCTAVEGACVIGSSKDCQRADACEASGLCTARRDAAGPMQCVAGRDRECRKSAVCESEGRCKAIGGVCAVPPPPMPR
jgi:anaerobic nitric oxide reductase transcription regulator